MARIDPSVLVFVSVEVLLELVVPTFTVPKLSEPGESEAFGYAPVPVKVTVVLPPDTLLFTFRLAERVPEPVGVNVTVTVQDEFAARELGQVFVWA